MRGCGTTAPAHFPPLLLLLLMTIGRHHDWDGSGEGGVSRLGVWWLVGGRATMLIMLLLLRISDSTPCPAPSPVLPHAGNPGVDRALSLLGEDDVWGRGSGD